MIFQAISSTSRVRLALASAVAAASLSLAGCNLEGIQISEKHLQPIPAATVALMERKGMSKESPILIRVFKEESELEVWKQDNTGQFALLKTYPICRWSGELGPKIKTGDRQAPEGFYTILPSQMNPNSSYYLSFNMGFPNAFDRAHGRTGAHLMVHGNCSSAGCYSMTDELIGEIFALGRDAFFGGQKAFQVQAYPFRMTALNMAKHRDNPHLAFWKMLKQGNDHFEVTRQQPKIDVCDRRYVFNAQAPANMSTPLRFDASAQCPTYTVEPEVASAVAAKTKADEAAFANYVRRGTPTVAIKTGRDGGMHPTLQAKLNPQLVQDDKGNVRWAVDNPSFGTASAVPNRPLDESPVVTAMAAADAPATTASVSASDVPMPRANPRRPSGSAVASAPAGGSPGGGGMFGNLFSTASDGTKSAATSVVRALGFGSDEPAPSVVRAQPAARPAARAAITAPADARPRPATQTAGAQPSPPRAEAATQTANAVAEPPSSSGVMSGAAPAVPAGSFDNRWGSFR